MATSRKINHIVIHTTATAPDASIQSIKNHWNSLGWKNYGYHIIVDASGEITLLTPLEKIANGVKGHNATSIHVAYIGGLKDGKYLDTRTLVQKIALRSTIKILKKMFQFAEILGHRDLSPDLNGDGKITPDEWVKLCPLFNVKDEF